MATILAGQLTPGTRFRLPVLTQTVETAESVEQAADAEPGFSGGVGLFIDGASRAHQVKVGIGGGRSVYLDKDAEVETFE